MLVTLVPELEGCDRIERGRDEARGVDVPKEAVEVDVEEGGKKELWDECAAMDEEVRGAEVATVGVG